MGPRFESLWAHHFFCIDSASNRFHTVREHSSIWYGEAFRTFFCFNFLDRFNKFCKTSQNSSISFSKWVAKYRFVCYIPFVIKPLLFDFSQKHFREVITLFGFLTEFFTVATLSPTNWKDPFLPECQLYIAQISDICNFTESSLHCRIEKLCICTKNELKRWQKEFTINTGHWSSMWLWEDWQL